ncbi:MAG TPA: MarR family winged helix-turn-helix transcriptional regulator [Bryobacteraceae bacterium]|jgi:DNA-binding MarR family transcriptional regulator|nr:MarR family winged helix-turn-helix transcriptional regulator [Bryobacteraceae bacterium]
MAAASQTAVDPIRTGLGSWAFYQGLFSPKEISCYDTYVAPPPVEFVRQFSLFEYQHLAEFRFRIRKFLHFSEQAARETGFEPQQHQLLLTVKGLPADLRPTITVLSQRLCLKHHSTVELINRMVEKGMVVRRHHSEDRREALIELTEAGEEALHQLSVIHWQEMQKQAPALSEALGAIVRSSVEDAAAL